MVATRLIASLAVPMTVDSVNAPAEHPGCRAHVVAEKFRSGIRGEQARDAEDEL